MCHTERILSKVYMKSPAGTTEGRATMPQSHRTENFIGPDPVIDLPCSGSKTFELKHW